MNQTFNDIADNVRNLSLNEKVEIKNIIEKSIIEEKRNSFYKDYIDSKKEQSEDKLVFSNDINQLKKMID